MKQMGNNINEIRLLNADEIECRIAVINEKGLNLLLYKDARVDQRILDETFGMFGWKRSHQSIDGNLYCTVEIRDRETGEWIAKQDVGTTGYAEKEKSQASDSFKRACFNWGIGRELYSAPFIWIPASKVQIQKKENRFYCNENFHVSSITYSESREIAGLELASDRGGTIFEWKMQERKPDGNKAASGEITENETAKNETTKKGASRKKSLSKIQVKRLETELQRTGVAMEAVQQRYHVDEPMQMSEETYNRIMSALSKTRSADVA